MLCWTALIRTKIWSTIDKICVCVCEENKEISKLERWVQCVNIDREKSVYSPGFILGVTEWTFLLLVFVSIGDNLWYTVQTIMQDYEKK